MRYRDLEICTMNEFSVFQSSTTKECVLQPERYFGGNALPVEDLQSSHKLVEIGCRILTFDTRTETR